MYAGICSGEFIEDAALHSQLSSHIPTPLILHGKLVGGAEPGYASAEKRLKETKTYCNISERARVK